MAEVDTLSNEELREALIEHGVSVGPVVDSTRVVYANKLRKILAEANPPSVMLSSVEHFASPRTPVASGPHDQSRSEQSSVAYNNRVPREMSSVSKVLELKLPGVQKESPSLLPDDGDQRSSSSPVSSQVPGMSQMTALRDGGYGGDGMAEEVDYCGEESSRYLSSAELLKYGGSSPLSNGSSIHQRNGNAYSYARKARPVERASSSKRVYVVGLVVVVATVFCFFVLQNLAAVSRGDANYEEL